MFSKKSNNFIEKRVGLILGVIVCCLLFSSCGGGSVTTLPEAPPPYPNFPVPYEASSQQSVPETVYSNQQQGYQNHAFSSTEYKPQTGSNNSWKSSPNALSPVPNYARFTVHANANLWLLVQDSNGNELDWLKLKEGEKVPLSHIGALTITCSSGQDIDIYNKDGRKLDIPESKKPGISIIRLQ